MKAELNISKIIVYDAGEFPFTSLPEISKWDNKYFGNQNQKGST